MLSEYQVIFGRLSQRWLEIRYEIFFSRHKAFKHSISEGVLGYQGYRHIFCQEQVGPKNNLVIGGPAQNGNKTFRPQDVSPLVLSPLVISPLFSTLVVFPIRPIMVNGDKRYSTIRCIWFINLHLTLIFMLFRNMYIVCKL